MAAEPIDLGAIIEVNAQARAELMAAIDGIPEDARESVWVGEWRLSDIVAHLAQAQAGYAEALEHMAKGDPPAIESWEPGPPHDWNNATIAARYDRTWDVRLADLEEAQKRHEAAIRSLPPGPLAPPAPGFVNSAGHERFHTGEIVDQRRERSLQWLA